MTTNYETARHALFMAMRVNCLEAAPDFERVLPLDDAYGVCTPEHLRSAMCLAGLDALLIRTPAVGDTVQAAIREGSIAVVLSGQHSTAENQRWLVGFDCGRGFVEFMGTAFAGLTDRPEPAHFCPIVIVVRGTLAQRSERESGHRWHIVD
jgi:hypothetical protein